MSKLKIWSCKVGEVDAAKLPSGADAPMRRAVAEAYDALVGEPPAFIFSGWGAELTVWERAVHEDTSPPTAAEPHELLPPWEQIADLRTQLAAAQARAEEARAVVRQCVEALDEEVEDAEQSHRNHCSEAWTSRGLHAPECRQDEVDAAREAIAAARRLLGEE